MNNLVRKFNKVAVLMGGVSSERGISVKSGTAVAKGLADAGYDVTAIELDRECVNLPAGIDAVFVALHGRFGEDGGVQMLLEASGIPYTGSRSLSCRNSMDKIRTREILEKAGVPVPKGQILHADRPISSIEIPVPFVVKPPLEGSSVGVSIVKEASLIEAAVAEGRKHSSGDILVEQYIPGREWTVGIVCDNVLPVIEIAPQLDGGWYSWNAKYFANGTTRYGFPGDNKADVELCSLCRDLAMKTFTALDARGLGRVDFRVTPEGEAYILELNAIPGFTENSLLPKAAAHDGISFSDLCARIMESAE